METKIRNKSSVDVLAMTAVMSALIAAISPFAIPIGPISITLCTLALYFSPYILGWKGASVATLVYILLGMIGMPVFSKFQAGLSVLMGPTGGYILGYVPMVVLAGLSIKLAPKNRMLQFLGMVIATMVLYVFGTIWYMMLSGNDLAFAMKWCVVPFIPLDLVKILIAIVLGPVLRERLAKAGFHPEG